MNYSDEIKLVGNMVKHVKESLASSDAREWDVVLGKQLHSVLPFLKEELKKAFDFQVAATSKDYSDVFPAYLRPHLQMLELRKQWLKLTKYDETVFSDAQSKQAVNSLAATYVLSLSFLFLYLRSDADVENSKNYQKVMGGSETTGKVFQLFFKGLQTFEPGGELYEALRNVKPTGKNLDAEMTYNDCQFFDTVASRLAYSFRSFVDSSS